MGDSLIKEIITPLIGQMDKRELLEKGYDIYSKTVRCLPKGYALLPRLIIWFPTYRCNLRCKMCTFYGEFGIPPNQKDEIEAMLKNIKESYGAMPLPFIGLMGGEPFMRKDIFDILSLLKKYGFKFSITTNLFLLGDEKIKELLDNPPADLRVSLDGPRKIHDKIRNKEGLFDDVTSTIKKIRGMSRGKGLSIRLNCTISSSNVKHISKLVEIAEELKVDLNYQHLQFLDEKRIKAHKRVMEKYFGCDLPMWRDMSTLSEEEVEVLKEQIRIIRKKGKKSKGNVTFLPGLPLTEVRDYYRNLGSYVHSKKCTFVWGAARINAKGDVFPCLDYFYGNINERRFDKIWNNKKARYFRTTLKKLKLFPGCVRCCKI